MIIELRSRHFLQNPLAQFQARRQVRDAVTNAYARFAGEYPQWTSALFDEHFVARGVMPLATQREEAGGRLDPKALSQAWAQQFHYGDGKMRARHVQEMRAAAAEFLRLLDETTAQ